MRKHHNNQIIKKVKYHLDDFVSKGFWAQILLLIGAALVLTLMFGIVAMNLGQPDYAEGYWTSLMHMIDQGAITGDEAGSDGYFIFMLIVTFIGMAFTSTIIAIVNNDMQKKLDILKNGHSAIFEKDHLLILGFNENSCTIFRELLEGGHKNGEHVCIVMADDLPKETMEQAVRESEGTVSRSLKESVKGWKKNKQIKVLIRSGTLTSENTFAVCAAESARTIFVNQENDSETIRILLALMSYLKKHHAFFGDDRMPTVIAIIHEKKNMSVARIAAGLTTSLGNKANEADQKILIFNDKEMLGQLFAQACICQGLPYVLDGLFNYRGSCIFVEKSQENEKYKEDNPLTGKTLPEIAAMAAGSIPLGFIRKKKAMPLSILLNPPEAERYQAGDRLIYLSERKKLFFREPKAIQAIGVPSPHRISEKPVQRNFLMIGWNETLQDMIKNLEAFCGNCMQVTLISPGNELFGLNMNCVSRVVCPDPLDWNDIEPIFEKNAFWFDTADERKLTNIVILSQDGTEKLQNDEKVILLLLNIRQYLKERGITEIGITSQILLPQNQALLQNDSSNDYVIASEISDRMIAQFLEDPRKYSVISNLLQMEDGSIQIKPLSHYADTAQAFNFEAIFEFSMNCENEIPLGWIRFGSGKGAENSTELVLNPSGNEREALRSGGEWDQYRLVVFVSHETQK